MGGNPKNRILEQKDKNLNWIIEENMKIGGPLHIS